MSEGRSAQELPLAAALACAALAYAALACAALGCGKRPAPGPTPAPLPSAVSSASASPLPADHALPGELAEGPESAFGLLLPRRMRVTARFPDAVFATGELPPDLVVAYVRQRVIAAQIQTGPAKTVFTRATTRSDPGRMMRVDVIGRGGATELFIREETRPPAREGLSSDERFRQLGLSPDGNPLDPTRLE
jgi:hypothetical protein